MLLIKYVGLLTLYLCYGLIGTEWKPKGECYCHWTCIRPFILCHGPSSSTSYGGGISDVSSTSWPSANIVIYGCKSDLIHIRRGTREGCPLSPLLYVITIETLAIPIGSNPNNYGISKVAGSISVLYLLTTSCNTEPIMILPNLFSTLSGFGTISRLRVNQTKSESLDINLAGSILESLQTFFSFKWCTHSLLFLRLRFTSDIFMLYQTNYISLYSPFDTELKNWHSFLDG